MSQESLNEREFELINIVGAKLAANQRDLSRYLNFSLGQTNMLLRRLITKGYIRINQLNKRKAEYILTPKGFSEKMRKSIKYTLKTINSISVILDRLKEVLSRLVDEGERDFFVLGGQDFFMLVGTALKELCSESYQIVHVIDIPKEGFKGVLLICSENISFPVGSSPMRMINLIEILASEQNVVLEKRHPVINSLGNH